MSEFNNIERLRRLTDRIHNAPFRLVKTELEILLNVIQSNLTTRLLLEGLLQREQKNLGAYAGLFVNADKFDHVVDLPFIKTAEQRAAFGYQVLTSLVGGGGDWEKVAKSILNVGCCYTEGKQPPVSNIIGRWVDVFICPVIDYLEVAHNTEDLVLALMIKYKQRSEWLERNQLLQTAKSDDEGNDLFIGQVEQRLKTDFYRYLFDRDIEFVLEARSPKGGGAVDVLTARFPDGRLLIVEAKVFDNEHRDGPYIKSGIKQAASYAEEWAEPYVYLLVYNVASNSSLVFGGASRNNSIWITSSIGREVRIVDVNLNNNLLASRSSQLSQVTINLV